MLSPTARRYLQALLEYPTKKQAAAAAGVSDRAGRRYLANAEFQAEYRRAFDALIEDAAQQSKQALSPAIAVLRDIASDGEEAASSRIAASRALLEYSLRIVELSDITRRIEELERSQNDDCRV